MSGETRFTSGWQPIGTAPKDGSKIDLWVVFPNGGQRWPDSFWNTVAGNWQHGHYTLAQYLDKPFATHWMPLPGPPEQQP